MIGDDIERLIGLLGKLPGLGPRSGRRAILHLMQHRDDLMVPLASALDDAAKSIVECKICGNLDTVQPCRICSDPTRDRRQICIVETVADLWALERSGAFSGTYHVLGGTLSALDGIGPDDLRIPRLLQRAAASEVEEVILALGATVDGQTTAHYIAERLGPSETKVTRLAHGVPLGGELDYMDDGTLTTALRGRRSL
ncbi:MAG: recombination mediator RecR [Pseudomonadota bacterium]